jgi:hypothetical protein
VQFYEDAQFALGNLRHSVIDRMVNCLKILEDAGNKGVLKKRALETIKRSRTGGKVKAKIAANIPKTTGISMPDTVNGLPVPAHLGVQQLSQVASFLRDKVHEFDSKRPFKCPLQICPKRYTSEKFLKAHWEDKHKGIPFPVLPVVVAAAVAGGGHATDVVVAEADDEDAANVEIVAPQKRQKVRDAADYETCAICPKTYLKKNRESHLDSHKHKFKAAAAVAAAAAAVVSQ